MTKIGLVTDSASDIPLEIAKEYGIEIVPLYIGLDGNICRDLYEITPEDVYTALNNGRKVTTASPSVGDFREIFKKLFDEKIIEFIYCVVLSSKLSGTFNAANIAKNFFPPDCIKVIDSKTATICLGFILLQAAEAIKAGHGVEYVGRLIQELIERNKFFAVLENFEHVFKGGRAVFFSKFIEKAIKLVPVLNIGRSGKVRLKKFAKNKRNALIEIYRLSLEEAKRNNSNRIGIFYGDDIEPAKELEKMLNQSGDININDIIITKITTVISAHTGPGIWGIAVSPKII